MSLIRLAGVGVLWTCCASAVQVRETMSYLLPAQLTVREPVILDVTVRNDLTETIAVDFGTGGVSEFNFGIQKPDGSRTPIHLTTTRPPGELSWFEPVGPISIQSGTSVSRSIVLSEVADFSQIGSYEVTIRFGGSVRTLSNGSVNVLREVRHTLHVLPRNEDALRHACDELAREAKDPDAVHRGRAVAALASIGDAIVIPYLLEVARSDPFASREVDALVRLGGPDARRALEELSKSSNGWTASAAQSGLKRIK
jgi:hypothetical protein